MAKPAPSPVTVRLSPILMAALLLVVGVAGCLGGEQRTEWAFQDTQINELRNLGRTGAGIRVGVLDTGINTGHASLDHLVDGNNKNGELRGFRDYLTSNFGVEFAGDDHGHGSHVIGIMSARGSSVGDKLLYGGIDLKGGSPNIELWVAKVCDEEGCPMPAIRSALQWMAGQELDIVSMSLGGDRNIPLIIDGETEAAVNALIDQGVVVIASAGNDGPNNDDVGQPSDIPAVISVGAIEEDGRVWQMSSRGNSGSNQCTTGIFGQSLGRCDPNKKPELVAPGVGILSAWAGDAYVRADGTSQATPFVTSVVALILEDKAALNSRAEVIALKSALINSAKPVAGQFEPHDNAAGYGIVQGGDALRAYAA